MDLCRAPCCVDGCQIEMLDNAHLKADAKAPPPGIASTTQDPTPDAEDKQMPDGEAIVRLSWSAAGSVRSLQDEMMARKVRLSIDARSKPTVSPDAQPVE